MNGKDIFLGLRYVDEDIIEEAEYGTFSSQEDASVQEKKRHSIRRPLLIAAVIALAAVLVGCAVVYVLRMQDVKIGEATATRDYRLVDGTYVEDPHEVSENILSLAGLKGSNAYQACAEFYDFQKDHWKDIDAQNDKAAELAETYNLKPEGEKLDFRNTRNLCDALGVERFYQDSEEIRASIDGGWCYDTGNFKLSFRFDFPEDKGYEVLNTSGFLRWNRTDCFSRDYVTLVDSGDWTERNYTTASGSNVLILQSPSQETGYIIADRGDALLSLQLSANIELLSEEDKGVFGAEYKHMTDRQIELVADAMDFTIQPRTPTQADVDAQAAIPQSATQNGWTVSLKSVETDGYVAWLTVSVTAPEGVAIPLEGNLFFENNGTELMPVNGETTESGGTIKTLEDGDGLNNTVDLLMIRDCIMQDGSAPFGKGTTWNLHIVDIVHSLYDSDNGQVAKNILVEGEWQIPITFDDSNGDYREIELLSQPIKAKASTGWGADGADRVEELEITSFILRRFSVELTCENENADFFMIDGKFSYAVMKDGSRVDIMNQQFAEPVDLDQVDYILLADGTKLPVPATAR